MRTRPPWRPVRYAEEFDAFSGSGSAALGVVDWGVNRQTAAAMAEKGSRNSRMSAIAT